MEGNTILKATGITKTFPGVKALSDIDFELYKGEVHALVGENGAGKSTLIKILMGVYSCDQGSIFVEGRQVSIRNEQDALHAGLRAVYQDVNLAPHLTVGENFYLGKLPKRHGMIAWKEIFKNTQKILDDLGISVCSKSRVGDLPIAQQEMVCIAKCTYENAKIITFDEPTALLTGEETQTLFQIIRKLKAQGISIIYISHRLEELFEICDRATILKDGSRVATKRIGELTQKQMVQMMVGRNLGELYSIQSHKTGEMVLEVRNLTRNGAFWDISFCLHKGEILGISGLVGSGRTEVVRSIFGAEKADSGEIIVHGKKVAIRKPQDAIALGIGLLPEDRRAQGLALSLPISFNINAVSFAKYARYGLVNLKKEKEIPEKYIKAVRIKTPSARQEAGKLSGGNQQKTVLGKWLAKECGILMFDEPTVGVDVGTKQEIYRLIGELTAAGIAVIVISSYLPEVMGLADEILVMYEGHVTGRISRAEANEALLMNYASGITGEE